MKATSREDITQLLLAWNEGDASSLEKLIPLVEAELRRLAERYMAKERPNHTLQPTALVNELYLRLIDWKNARWHNRAHFLGVAAKLMRRILVDHARRQQNLKRGGQVAKVSLDEMPVVSSDGCADPIALDDALNSLASLDARKSQIVELRFFGGLTVEETAEVMKISPRTVKREWSLAQAWLLCALSGEEHDDA
jgi:RNA polymerase sigma factor (TIGR02999 family)